MGDTVSAVAALVAATTGIAALVITAVLGVRRERRQWRRDALTDAFVAFLDASWRSSDALLRSRGLRNGPRLSGVQDEAALAHENMRMNLTRIRLLASTKVVVCGRDLLRSHDAALAATDEDIDEIYGVIRHHRLRMVELARHDIEVR